MAQMAQTVQTVQTVQTAEIPKNFRTVITAKTRKDLSDHIHEVWRNVRVDGDEFVAADLERLIKNCSLTDPPSHGIVIGEVDLWGRVLEHSKGYRAEHARPAAFYCAIGDRSDEALAELRAAHKGDMRRAA